MAGGGRRDERGRARPAETFLRPSQHPRASTSALAAPAPRRAPANAPDRRTQRVGDCWCGAPAIAPPGTLAPAPARPGKRARSSDERSLAAAATAVVALAAVPTAAASPVPTREGDGESDSLRQPRPRGHPPPPQPPEDPVPGFSPTPAPTPALQRRATPLFEPTTSWSLNGRTGAGRLAAEPTGGARAGAAMQDNIDIAADSESVARSSITFTPAASASASLANAAASSSVSAAASSASSTSASTGSTKFVVPSGWGAKSRKTDYYAVPVIISTSVILAVIVIGAIVGSVVWRRKARHDGRRASRKDPEKAFAGDKEVRGGAVGRAVAKGLTKVQRAKGKGKGSADGASDTGGRAISSVGGGRLRQRRTRRTRAPPGDCGDDEGTALTRSVHSGSSGGTHAPPDTLTHRLAARLRLTESSPAPSAANATVAFSHSAPLARSRSTIGSTLSRTSSTASFRSDLGQPADRPSTPVPATVPTPPASSFGGLFALDASLPAPGPPAYRPSSSTIGSTSRLTASILPRRPVPRDDDLRWPEEKARASVTASARSTTPPPPVASSSSADPPPSVEDEHAGPAVGEPHEPFAAHVATDDKQLLALLAQQVSAAAASSTSLDLPEATAPDADVGPDGFERFDDEEREQATMPSPPQPVARLLPLPPAAVRTAFDFAPAEEEHEALPLPVYAPRMDAPEPSAPPADDDEDYELEYEIEEEYDEERAEDQYPEVLQGDDGEEIASMSGRAEHCEV